jgi:hypothetical protein
LINRIIKDNFEVEKIMKKLLLIFVFLFLFAACSNSQSDDASDSAAIEQACVEEGGTFLAEFNECENISEAVCTDLGGLYDECGSSCRHEPADAICTMQCVELCAFDSDQ